MPAEVKILITGTSNADFVAETGVEKTYPTVSLVRDGGIIMVVDPGIMESPQILIDALKKEGLTLFDINTVCVTHSHLDHYRNVGMFPNAKVIDYWGIWERDTINSWAENFTENIQILHTPGHDYTSITLFVNTGLKSNYPGVVAICGDNFWKENYPHDTHDDPFASNPERLKDSREVIVKKADWIIPGHGPIYKNDKTLSLEDRHVPKKGAELSIVCKKCGRRMKQPEKCKCRPYLCFHCCQCGIDCDLCSCSHKI